MAQQNVLDRGQVILLNKIGEMSPDMQQNFKKANTVYGDAVYYKRYEVTGGGGLINVLYNDDAIKDGYCNLSKQKIAQGCAFLIQKMTLRVAIVDAQITSGESTIDNPADEAMVTYGTVAAATASPVLQNAELELDIAQKKICQIPFNAFNQEGTNVDSEKNSYVLSAPKLTTYNDELQFRIHFPQSKSLPSDKKIFVEVALHGAELRIG